MKITSHIQHIQSKNLLDVSFDVGKANLDYYAELPGPGHSLDKVEHHFANNNKAVIRELQKLKNLAKERDYNGVRIICEPTGGFERRLLRLARKQGCYTAYVNGESVHKAQIIESNDHNKTDNKDPKTIHLLAKLGKTLTHRNLTGDWLILRSYNVRYDRLEVRVVQQKNRIHRICRELFCELGFKSDWLFDGKAAERIVDAYGLNPYRILHCGETRVRKRLRSLKVITKTIDRLFKYARESVLQELDPEYIQFLEEDLRMEFEELKRCQKQMQETREKMIEILDRLVTEGKVHIEPEIGLITPFMLARIIGETGPLEDFKTIDQLLRYAGMNLRQRQSGTFTGQNKLSKKGRPLLRKFLSQAILSLVKKTELYGNYYHGKKEEGMIGPKAMTATARKFLKLLFGIHKSKMGFIEERVFECKSRFMKAA